MKKTKLLLPILTVGTLVGTATTLVACAKKQEEETKYLDVVRTLSHSNFEVTFYFRWINKKDGDVIEITSVTGSFTGYNEGTFAPGTDEGLKKMSDDLNAGKEGECYLTTDIGTFETKEDYYATLKVEFKINGVATTQNFEGIKFVEG